MPKWLIPEWSNPERLLIAETDAVFGVEALLALQIIAIADNKSIA
jgi:hypothetical protein